MSDETLREACEAVQRANDAVIGTSAGTKARRDAERDVELAEYRLRLQIGTIDDAADRILAALDAEREAGRREALEEARAMVLEEAAFAKRDQCMSEHFNLHTLARRIRGAADRIKDPNHD